MSQFQIKTNIQNNDLSKDMRKANGDKMFDFRTKEMKEITEQVECFCADMLEVDRLRKEG